MGDGGMICSWVTHVWSATDMMQTRSACACKLLHYEPSFHCFSLSEKRDCINY